MRVKLSNSWRQTDWLLSQPVGVCLRADERGTHSRESELSSKKEIFPKLLRRNASPERVADSTNC